MAETADKKPAEVVAPPAEKPKDEKPADAVTPPAEKPADKAEDKPEEKTEEIPLPDKVVPEKYELKLPEGSLLSESRVEKLTAIAKQKKLSNEEAQALVESENESLREFASSQYEGLKKTSDQWLTAAKADKEIGGEKFNEVVEVAHRAVSHFSNGDQSIKEFLDKSGMGNKPEVIKFFYNIGKTLQPAKIIGSGVTPPSKPNVIDRLYDHPTSKQT